MPYTPPPDVSDAAYSTTTWDGVTTVAPSKNAVRDYLVSIQPNAEENANNINVAATNAVMSKSLSITAGDRIEMLVEGAITNNSGATKGYVITFNCGSLNVSTTDGAAVAASATNKQTRILRAIVGVKNTSSAWMSAYGIGYAPAALGSGGQVTAGLSLAGFQRSTSDLTGAQTLSINIAANVAIPTQTFEVTSWSITKLASNP